MRIIAGKLKGTSLFMTKGKNTRPLKDRARESIFNLLLHSNKIFFNFKKANVLDLYAGTGSFGLECLSREAASVCFVEKEKSALEVMGKNIEKVKIKKKTSTLACDVLSLANRKNILKLKYHLIFCDPPFKFNNADTLIKFIYDKNLLQENGIVIIHLNKNTKEKLPENFKLIEERIYGISKIIFGKILY